jgi:diaminopimelate epimerase
MGHPFVKVESIGNDFPLIHDDGSRDLPALAQTLSDRRFGIGGDGLLVVGDVRDQVLPLRMFNPDGTEDFCGNGIRAAAWWAFTIGRVGQEFAVRHGGRDILVRIEGDRIQSTLGPASYHPDQVPLSTLTELFDATVWSGIDAGMPLSLHGSALTTGSTHVVIPIAALPDDETVRSVSPKIEHDARYPERASVIWRHQTGPDELTIRIWERGVGETLGCGTGSSAAAADFFRRRGHGGTVTVHNPGGAVTIRADRWDAPLVVEGTARVVFEGEWSPL